MILLVLALQAEAVWEEVDGRLVLEVEAAGARGDWKVESGLAGFTGTGYLTWTGPDLFGAPGKDPIAWTVHVSTPGRYRLLLRNRHDFEDATLQNDCFTKLDDGPWLKTFSSTRGSWTWATRHELEGGDKPPAAYDLGPGVHRFQVSGRSKGFSLDRIHLVRDGIPGAEDVAAPVSPTLFQAMAGPAPHPAPLAQKLRAGRGAGDVLRLLREKRESPSMLAALSSFLERREAAARALLAADPAEGVERLQELARMFDGDEAGARLAKDVEALRKDPAIQAELKAAALWRKVEDAVAALRPHNGARDPRSEGFRRLNGPAMAGIAATCRRLAKDHPGTKAAAKAEALLALYR
jgi:hypothetical protein